MKEQLISQPRLLLHVGLPRTGTTTLQRNVFPMMSVIRYVGKPWNNQLFQFQSSPISNIKSVLHSDRQKSEIRNPFWDKFLASIIFDLQIANIRGDKTKAKQIANVWSKCVEEILKSWHSEKILFSDESLIESFSGRHNISLTSVQVGLEQIAETKILENALVSLVLRNPISFLKASFYKSEEFRQRDGYPSESFDSYIRQQIAIFLRKPSASRIFLCMQKPFVEHMKGLCPNLVVNHYEELINEESVIDALFRFKSGEKPICMRDLPRENISNRDDKTIDFILSAADIPKGIDMEKYTATFSETLDHYGLNKIFEETSMLSKSNN